MTISMMLIGTIGILCFIVAVSSETKQVNEQQLSKPFFDALREMQSEIKELRSELKSSKDEILKLKIGFDRSNSWQHENDRPVSIGRMPNDCTDLEKLGYFKNGFFTVKSSSSNKLLTVYCDFTKPWPRGSGFQTFIGFNDVKTTSVYFHVSRKTTYSIENTVVPFETEVTNIGSAMTTATGIFTAPKPGRYSFSFFGLSVNDSIKPSYQGGNHIQIRLNGVKVATAYGDEIFDTFGLQAILNLQEDDKVTLFLLNGAIYDDNFKGPYLHFTGQLLEEDLIF